MEFGDRADLLRHLNTLDYRGALCIDRAALEIDSEGQPVLLRFDALARVGATAIRTNSLLWYAAGVGISSGDISHESGKVTIRLFMRMKLSPAGQVVARVQTGHWPPWATITIEYSFDMRDDAARIRYLVTRVPSLTRYVNWQKDSAYRMEYDLSAAAYEGFVEAGGCHDASAHAYSLWTL